MEGNNTGCGHILWVSYFCNIGTFFVYTAERGLTTLVTTCLEWRTRKVSWSEIHAPFKNWLIPLHYYYKCVAMTTWCLYYHCGCIIIVVRVHVLYIVSTLSDRATSFKSRFGMYMSSFRLLCITPLCAVYPENLQSPVYIGCSFVLCMSVQYMIWACTGGWNKWCQNSISRWEWSVE